MSARGGGCQGWGAAMAGWHAAVEPYGGRGEACVAGVGAGGGHAQKGARVLGSANKHSRCSVCDSSHGKRTSHLRNFTRRRHIRSVSVYDKQAGQPTNLYVRDQGCRGQQEAEPAEFPNWTHV